MSVFDKNRKKEPPTFGNINFLGKCNANCFFCLGKDLGDVFDNFNHLSTKLSELKNLDEYLDLLHRDDIKKVYITGQNCDSLQYKYLNELITLLHDRGFGVGLRTNGYLAMKMMKVINRCELSTGYTINSLNGDTNFKIMGRRDLPDWDKILKATERPRVQIVINRLNSSEFLDIVRFVAKYPNVRYIQARRISTDTRQDLLLPDVLEYEKIYVSLKHTFTMKGTYYLAEIYEMYGKDVCFWRTVKTSVNSYNYFSDGTISKEYFIIEGYLKSVKGKED